MLLMRQYLRKGQLTQAMSDKHEKCYIPLDPREMKIRTTRKYHLIAVNWVYKTTENGKNWAAEKAQRKACLLNMLTPRDWNRRSQEPNISIPTLL